MTLSVGITNTWGRLKNEIMFTDESWVNTAVTMQKVWEDWSPRQVFLGRTFHWVKDSYRSQTMFCKSRWWKQKHICVKLKISVFVWKVLWMHITKRMIVVTLMWSMLYFECIGCALERACGSTVPVRTVSFLKAGSVIAKNLFDAFHVYSHLRQGDAYHYWFSFLNFNMLLGTFKRNRKNWNEWIRTLCSGLLMLIYWG
jgi:hypothetical protein